MFCVIFCRTSLPVVYTVVFQKLFVLYKRLHFTTHHNTKRVRCVLKFDMRTAGSPIICDAIYFHFECYAHFVSDVVWKVISIGKVLLGFGIKCMQGIADVVGPKVKRSEVLCKLVAHTMV